MSIYKGLLMLGGYVTHVEHLEDTTKGTGATAPDARPTAGRRAVSPRSVMEPESVRAEPGCLAGGCC